MYPMLNEGVSLGTFQYKGYSTKHYFVENSDGEEYEIDVNLYNALLNVDGTKPLELPDKGSNVLPLLKQNGIVHTSRFVKGEDIFNRFILFPISDNVKKWHLICRAINAILPEASVLIFVIGMYSSGMIYVEYGFNWLLYCSLLIASIVLHEMGHLVAGIAYGYKINEVGVLLFGVIPAGMYITREDNKYATRSDRIQFSLAGAEVNFVIAGLCLIASTPTMIALAKFNILFAAINLLPASGLDGESALCAFLGLNKIRDIATEWIINKKRRNKLIHLGLPGYICFFLFVLTLVSDFVIFILIGIWLGVEILIFFNNVF